MTATPPSPPPPLAGVADVIARMQAILTPLAASDGVAAFTRLYLTVTESIQEELGSVGSGFADPAFLADLDRRFAELFFAAYDAPSGHCPAAWAPLFEARRRRGVAPIQFALAGMNAHINRDLPVAIVAACEHAAIEPREGSPQHHDYLRVNTLLANVEAKIKAQYLTGWLHTLDQLIHPVHRLDDLLAIWDIGRARDAAWTNAETLWALRTTPPLDQRYLAALDRSVGLASRGLLTPADSWLGKLNRLLHP
jgi:hypothetical protein